MTRNADAGMVRRVVTSPYLLLAFPPLFWAGNAVVGRVAMADMSPYALSFWRWVLALCILLPFTGGDLLANWPTIRARWGRIVVLGTLSVGGFNLLLYMALQTTTAVNATLLSSVMPLAIMLLSWLILKESFGVWKSLGLVFSIAGVVLVISRGVPSRLLDIGLHEGDVLMLLAVGTWSLFSVLLRALPPGLPPMVFLTAQIGGGLVVVTPLYVVMAALGQAHMPMTWDSAAVVAFTAIFPALLAFYFWNWGVNAVGATAAGFYTNLVPVFTAILGAVFLAERIVWFHWVGMALIFCGITLASRGGARTKPA